MIKALNTKLRYARYFTWASYVLFLPSMIVGGYLSGTPLSLLLIVSIPLLLLLYGLMKEKYKSLAMISFVTLLYFIPMVGNVMTDDVGFFDISSVALIAILFIASMLFSRWKQYSEAGYGDSPTATTPTKN